MFACKIFAKTQLVSLEKSVMFDFEGWPLLQRLAEAFFSLYCSDVSVDREKGHFYDTGRQQ